MTDEIDTTSAATLPSPVVFERGGRAKANSRDVAAMFGKRHADVLRAIEALLQAAPACERSFALTSESVQMPNGGTREGKAFEMDRDGFTLLAMGFTGPEALQFKVAYIEAFNAMESRLRASPPPPAQLSRMDLIRLALDAEQEAQEERGKRIVLEAKVEADAPKVAFAESVVAASDAISLGQAAKILGTGRNRLVAKMRQAGWLTRTNEPYQMKINAGLLDVKIGSWEHPQNGLQRSVTALVTGKGLAKLRSLVCPQGTLGGAPA